MGEVVYHTRVVKEKIKSWKNALKIQTGLFEALKCVILDVSVCICPCHSFYYLSDHSNRRDCEVITTRK